ncbi:hypothetical protein ACTXT7_017371, partial [Hymenolepis weldensis]
EYEKRSKIGGVEARLLWKKEKLGCFKPSSKEYPPSDHSDGLPDRDSPTRKGLFPLSNLKKFGNRPMTRRATGDHKYFRINR